MWERGRTQGASGVLMYSYILFIIFTFLSSLSFAKEVHFEIPAGTKDSLLDWNSESEPVIAEVGDVLIIKNLDSHPHQLHTDGRPCAHGDVIQPNGGTWSCVLEKEYDAFSEKEPTRDHFNYDLKFWIVVKAKAEDAVTK